MSVSKLISILSIVILLLGIASIGMATDDPSPIKKCDGIGKCYSHGIVVSEAKCSGDCPCMYGCDTQANKAYCECGIMPPLIPSAN